MKTISDLRKEKGFTQQELADQLGVSAVSIHNYESGKRLIPYDKAVVLSRILEVPMNEIFLPQKFSIRK